VHFADSNRQPIGNGHLSMPEIAEALNKIGYEEYLSAEAFPFPNPDQAAAKTIESFKQYFKTIRLHT
jgi:sugar phosphate isomerase/epimerase